MDLTHHLLLDLYGSVDNSARWTPMLDRLCDIMGVRSAVVQIFDHERASGHAQWTARDTGTLAQAAAHDRCINRPDNPRLAFGALSLASGEIGSDQRLFGSNHPMLGVLRERLRQVDLGSAIWAAFPIDNGRHFTLVLHRHSDDMRDLEETEESFLNMLLPHLKQSVSLSRGFAQLTTRNYGFEAALDKVRTGLIICSAELKLGWHNCAAAKIFETSSSLSIAHGELWCGSPEASGRLRLIGCSRSSLISQRSLKRYTPLLTEQKIANPKRQIQILCASVSEREKIKPVKTSRFFVHSFGRISISKPRNVWLREIGVAGWMISTDFII